MNGRRRTPRGAARRGALLGSVGLVAALALGAGAFTALQADAATATLHVATTGSDSAAGTLAAPLKTLQKAVSLATPGTTILVRGGTYAPTSPVTISTSGTAAAPITLSAYGSETVVLDAEAMPYTPAAAGASLPSASRGAIHMTASYWTISKITVTHGPYGIYCDDCSHNTFSRLVTADNYETGLQIQGDSSYNTVSDVDSYGNHDPRKYGESADGIGIKEGSGTGNVVEGVRLWNNSDDGIDLWEFASSVTVEDSVSYGNGVNRWGFDEDEYSGDGVGFKLGGGDEDPSAAHVVSNCMSWSNSGDGFTSNGNPGAMTVDHSTAWKNGGTAFDFAGATPTLTKNLAVSNGATVSLGSGTASGNSWNIGGTWTFVSTSTSTITGARASDGSIPTSSFLRPSNGKDVGATI